MNQTNHHRNISTFNKHQKNTSLPFINQLVDNNVRVNAIHKHLESSKQEILTRKARNKALIRQIFKNQTKKYKTIKQIQYLNAIKDRNQEHYSFKKQLNEKKEEQIQQLKYNAMLLKNTTKQKINNAKQVLIIQNKEKVTNVKQMINENEKILKNQLTQSIEKKYKKIDQIKHQLEEAAHKIEDFKTSRISFGKKNYQSKLQISIKKANKAQKTAMLLANKHNSLIINAKKTHQQYISSLNELYRINPQNKNINLNQRKFFTSQIKLFDL